MKHIKSIAIILAVIIAFSVVIFVDPVRALAVDTMSVFRQTAVKSINITLMDIEQLMSMQGQQTEIGINPEDFENKENFIISKSYDAAPEYEITNIKDFTDFNIALPSKLSDETPQITVKPASSGVFAIDADKANSYLSAAGLNAALPSDLTGKEIFVEVPSAIGIKYEKAVIFAGSMPTVTMPQGVSKDVFYKVLTSLPMIPENIKNQLDSINDWDQNVYLPYLDGFTREIDINGDRGFVYALEDLKTYFSANLNQINSIYNNLGDENSQITQEDIQGIDIGQDQIMSCIIWSHGNTVYMISGQYSASELTVIARSMK